MRHYRFWNKPTVVLVPASEAEEAHYAIEPDAATTTPTTLVRLICDFSTAEGEPVIRILDGFGEEAKIVLELRVKATERFELDLAETLIKHGVTVELYAFVGVTTEHYGDYPGSVTLIYED